jgi:hypothetical protein
MTLQAKCPFCSITGPFRRDKRGGRYFRCGTCQIAFFFSGKAIIDRLEGGGTWSFRVETGADEKGSDSVSDFLDSFFGQGG